MRAELIGLARKVANAGLDVVNGDALHSAQSAAAAQGDRSTAQEAILIQQTRASARGQAKARAEPGQAATAKVPKTKEKLPKQGGVQEQQPKVRQKHREQQAAKEKQQPERMKQSKKQRQVQTRQTKEQKQQQKKEQRLQKRGKRQERKQVKQRERLQKRQKRKQKRMQRERRKLQKKEERLQRRERKRERTQEKQRQQGMRRAEQRHKPRIGQLKGRRQARRQQEGPTAEQLPHDGIQKQSNQQQSRQQGCPHTDVGDRAPWQQAARSHQDGLPEAVCGQADEGARLLYEQCGGRLYTGPTRCGEGARCKRLSDLWWQCVRA